MSVQDPNGANFCGGDAADRRAEGCRLVSVLDVECDVSAELLYLERAGSPGSRSANFLRTPASRLPALGRTIRAPVGALAQVLGNALARH